MTEASGLTRRPRATRFVAATSLSSDANEVTSVNLLSTLDLLASRSSACPKRRTTTSAIPKARIRTMNAKTVPTIVVVATPDSSRSSSAVARAIERSTRLRASLTASWSSAVVAANPSSRVLSNWPPRRSPASRPCHASRSSPFGRLRMPRRPRAGRRPRPGRWAPLPSLSGPRSDTARGPRCPGTGRSRPGPLPGPRRPVRSVSSMFPTTVSRFVTASISSLCAEVMRKTAPPTTNDDTNISAISRSTLLFLDRRRDIR